MNSLYISCKGCSLLLPLVWPGRSRCHYFDALRRLAIPFTTDTPSSDSGNMAESLSHFIFIWRQALPCTVWSKVSNPANCGALIFFPPHHVSTLFPFQVSGRREIDGGRTQVSFSRRRYFTGGWRVSEYVMDLKDYLRVHLGNRHR